VITSRWAMSYLRGPLTLAELKPLLLGAAPAPAPSAPVRVAAAAPLLQGIEQMFADASELEPAVVIEGRVTYRKLSPPVSRELQGPWVVPLGPEGMAWDRLRVIELPALEGEPRAGVTLGPLPADAAAAIRDAGKAFPKELASRPLEILWHRSLKLAQDEGETEESFRARCTAAARAAAEPKAEQARRQHQEKERGLEAKLGKEQLELARDQQELAGRKRQQQVAMAAGVGDTILSGLGALLGGRRSGISTAIRRGASTAKQWTGTERMTDRAQAEVTESEEAIAALQQELANLDAELEQELARLDEDAVRLAGQTEPLTLIPASRDISVRRVALAWLPHEPRS
jgi:hypothetical protein